MPWNLRVLPSPYCGGLILVLLLISGGTLAGEQWYRSNAAGMTLERIPSRIVALRNTYCLSIGFHPIGDLPGYLREYYRPSYQIELHILYEKGIETRRRWILRDPLGITRLVSSLSSPVPQEESPANPRAGAGELLKEEAPLPEPAESLPAGFIELYDENNLITEEHQFSSEGNETIITYFYNKQTLIRAETRLKTLPGEPEEEAAEPIQPSITLITTDNYRYSRSNSLRAVERIYHQMVSSDQGGANSLSRLQFPPLGLKSRVDESFVIPGTPYGSTFPEDLIPNGNKPGDQVLYTTDARGRVLTETRRDEGGRIQGEVRNTWIGDRLGSTVWKAGEDEGRIEYEYDAAGDRILERNYRKGVLERTVRREHDREIEELYMDGRVILRAIWEKGRKISEERVRPSPSGKGGLSQDN